MAPVCVIVLTGFANFLAFFAWDRKKPRGPRVLGNWGTEAQKCTNPETVIWDGPKTKWVCTGAEL